MKDVEITERVCYTVYTNKWRFEIYCKFCHIVQYYVKF